MRDSACLIAVLAVLAFAVLTASANVYVWDQTNDGFTTGLVQNLTSLGPIGQEFTPSGDLLEVAQVWLDDMNGGDGPSDFILNVRLGTIDGSILGTSESITLPDGFDGVTTFEFLPVPLVAQTLYVIEIVQVGNLHGGVMSSGGPNSTYPLGRQIALGVPQENNDLWFREGTIEAASVETMTWGRVKNLYR